MGYKKVARALNRAKEYEEECKKYENRIDNLLEMLRNQKTTYMNVVKMLVLQCGTEDGDSFMINIPLDLSDMENWMIETNPDEATNSLIMRVKKK